jgi:hypothetical protein
MFRKGVTDLLSHTNKHHSKSREIIPLMQRKILFFLAGSRNSRNVHFLIVIFNFIEKTANQNMG